MKDSFCPDVLQAHARTFDTAVFRTRMAELIESLVAGHLRPAT
jgi:hypothetical protein